MKEEINILLNKLYLHQASREDVETLCRLLKEDSFPQHVYDLYEDKWGTASNILDERIQERMYKQICQQIEFPKLQHTQIELKPTGWKKWLRIASVILFPVLTATITWLLSTSPWEDKKDEFYVSVDTGQRAQVQLPDGSRVWLNSASVLYYDRQNKTRKARLYGEAYFEVEKLKKSPFIVEVDELSVEVLGTRFNVKGYEDDRYIATTLIEGSVRIQIPGESKIIRPSDRVVYSREDHTLNHTTVNTDYAISWINNGLAFEQETLEEIARILERRFDIQILFETDQLRNIRFTGNLKNTNLEDILQYIAFSAPIHYSIEDAVITIKKNVD